ncbi:hypothetical protein SDJN03_18108, partial [Cucurbita argyrosperma subsp. sororia]
MCRVLRHQQMAPTAIGMRLTPLTESRVADSDCSVRTSTMASWSSSICYEEEFEENAFDSQSRLSINTVRGGFHPVVVLRQLNLLRQTPEDVNRAATIDSERHVGDHDLLASG